MKSVETSLLAALVAIAATTTGWSADDAAPLPPGVQAVWDFANAHRETTPTRERICINGLWRWRPANGKPEQTPHHGWGYFKVPGCWPGITDYMQKDSQTVYPHSSWKDQPLNEITAAWYEREIAVPGEWRGRRITLAVEYLNSFATVYVDGAEAGELRFPGGELELTPFCRAGAAHVLTLQVTALPLKSVLLSYNDTNTAREVQGSVARRGLCGDVYLAATPSGPRLNDIKIDTSFRKQEIAIQAGLAELAPGATYRLRARIAKEGKAIAEFQSDQFRADVQQGRFDFARSWAPDSLWDIHTPQNVYDLTLSLESVDGNVLDTSYNERFGFREFWIDGRDFYLNGTRIFLSAVPLDNAQISAALASYDGARESLQRLKSFGINFVYTHNYGCEPGTHLGFAEILRAADDVGMLVALSQPHFSHYEWQAADADQNNGYERHATWYAHVAGSHPSVVAYSMSHNATGYGEDMNPHMIDGLRDPRTSSYELNNAGRALRAEAIVKRLDPARIVYHHSSGNLGSMHTINFYPNFVPIQEMSDWFEHWATHGVKPVFTVEYGAPFTWDWAMYRGWYKDERVFGSARVPWDFCLAEWNSQFLGDRAFQISEYEKANLRWEARQFREGKLWHRWDYPHDLSSKLFDERYTVIARYISDNWPAFRTWGVSATTPWEHGQYWKLRDGVDQERENLPVNWQTLQRPGFSPDFVGPRYERMDLAYDRSDWQPTAAAQALLRYNLPLLGYLAGKADAFTSKDHLFTPGETVQKQAIVINNSRESLACDCRWSFDLPQPIAGREQVTVATGEQARIPLQFPLPEMLPPGEYRLRATFKFSSGESQEDSLLVHVLPRSKTPSINARIAVWDPRGETTSLLNRMGIPFQAVDAGVNLAGYDVLVVGKAALTLDSAAPDISRVPGGLRVLLFEQTSDVLEKRFGFRVAEYGLRELFPRVPDHPLLAGLAPEHLRDWRGEATLLSPQLTYEMRPRHGPTVRWCDIPVSRLWRCGNRGNVASVLIEKPARGDFLPILDGGWSLQYSPLLEHRDGAGLILFCQMDVTGRTSDDPAAETLAHNLLRHVADWKPGPSRRAVYVGERSGRTYLEAAGIDVKNYEAGTLTSDDVLIVGPDGGKAIAGDKSIPDWLRGGGNLLAIGLDQQDAAAIPLSKLRMKDAEHIAAWFAPPSVDSPFAGVGPAVVHNRDPRKLPLVASGATILGNGVLANDENSNIVFCQIAPWKFVPSSQPNLKKTYRRSSFLVARLLANLGVAAPSPIAARFADPVEAAAAEKRWEQGLYGDLPEEWDDPYRFFRW